MRKKVGAREGEKRQDRILVFGNVALMTKSTGMVMKNHCVIKRD